MSSTSPLCSTVARAGRVVGVVEGAVADTARLPELGRGGGTGGLGLVRGSWAGDGEEGEEKV